ncbi:MAG: hypothetical protein GY896_19880 [Gammaproteobacteria bacterium]|nr:hypothetical protein [Gammaproteobacteria bacterium]MCP4980300.1 hypothetical protein [Gammaproteobacteria bacterium]
MTASCSVSGHCFLPRAVFCGLSLEEGDEDPMRQVLGCSVSYRIAIGPQQGRRVFTLQTIPSWEEDDRFVQVAKASGFSLHSSGMSHRPSLHATATKEQVAW